MNEIINIFLAGDKFIPEMQLRNSGFRYSACKPFTKKQWQTFKETGNLRSIHLNELDKACYQNNMASWDFKNLPRCTASDKVLRLILLKSEIWLISKRSGFDGL